MDVGLHHLAQRRIDQPMPSQRQAAGKRGADDVDTEMPLPAARAGMSGMLVAVVVDLQRLRGQGRVEQFADARHPPGVCLLYTSRCV